MVKRIFRILHKEISGLHEAAYLLGFFTILSQVLGLLRDRLFAHHFGAGEILDMYYASFRIPDFIFISVASLVSVSVLVPFFIEKIDKNEKEARNFIDSIFSSFFLVIIVVSIIAFAVVPQLLDFIFPGFVGKAFHESLITLTRIMLLSPIFLGLSNFLASITQAYRRFFIYALSPLLYNLGIIVGVLFLYPLFGLKGLAFGVVFGSFCHLMIQVPFVVGKSMMPRIRFSVSLESLRKIMWLSLSRTLALSVTQVAIMFLLSLASLMTSGSIAVFNLSWNLQSVPLSIFGVSYTVALFPSISRLFSNGEKDKFVSEIVVAAKHIIFWSVPAAVLFIVLRAQIVRVILGSGQFSWSDTRLTAAALALFSVSVLAQSFFLLFVRGYYASGNTKKPLIINCISGVLIVGLSYFFTKFFSSHLFFRYFIEHLFRVEDIVGTEVLMLPLGFSLATIINAVLLWITFSREFKGFSKPVLRTFFQSFGASIIMGFVSYLVLVELGQIFDLNTFAGIFFQGFIAGVVGIAVGLFLLKILGSQELKDIWKTLHRKIWKAEVILPEQESL